MIKGKGREQRPVTGNIDQAGNAAGIGVNGTQCQDAESGFHFAGGYVDTVLYVVGCFPECQWQQATTKRDALSKLPKVMGIEGFVQFRLAHKDDLQEFVLSCFQVGEQTELFQDRF